MSLHTPSLPVYPQCTPSQSACTFSAFISLWCPGSGLSILWLLNLSLSPALRLTSEGKLNILRAVCWCLYLIKFTDEVLIYCWAVFTLYYKEITQLEWDQAGNTVSRFHNLMAKKKTQESRQRSGGEQVITELSWHEHDNVQEAPSLYNTAASMLTTDVSASCVQNWADELEFSKWGGFHKQMIKKKENIWKNSLTPWHLNFFTALENKNQIFDFKYLLN